VLGYRLELGLDRTEQGLLALTLLLGVSLWAPAGRRCQGIVHLVIFAAFLFFAVVP
jgi:Ca2+:H+ antiporter